MQSFYLFSPNIRITSATFLHWQLRELNFIFLIVQVGDDHLPEARRKQKNDQFTISSGNLIYFQQYILDRSSDF